MLPSSASMADAEPQRTDTMRLQELRSTTAKPAARLAFRTAEGYSPICRALWHWPRRLPLATTRGDCATQM